SVINVSAMSFGSLSARAVESMNKGVKMAGAYHNTGEGGLSPYHSHGGDVIFHFGTGYFGVRDDEGNFSLEKLVALVEKNPFVKAIEIKLSQGAKPGKGGVLPAAKITQEISDIRHVPLGKDVLSPPNHSAFSNVPELMEFIEQIAEATGLPVGIKAAIGKLEQWKELAKLMAETGKGPDFITVDGGEGGTGAAPPSFADHVSLPWVYGFSDLYKVFKDHNLCERIVFIGSGKLGFPAKAAMAFAMGADCINVAREAMMSIGCIQAQVCHTNRCPSGVATQKKWLQQGIHVPLKSDRLAQYFKTFRKELLEITHAAGYEHPCQFLMQAVQLNVAREAMMSIGCIQAQVCHTNRCPSGVATQKKWLQQGIHVPLKSDRLAQYFKTFRKELLEITHAAGYEHPCQFHMEDIQVNVDDDYLSTNLRQVYKYQKDKVPFESIEELYRCAHLGSLPFHNKATKTKDQVKIESP